MDKRNKKEIYLKGLSCANCAVKIEDGTNGIPGVGEASMNFSTRTLMVEIDEGHHPDEVIKDIKTLVRDIEPDVQVIEKNDILDEEDEEEHGDVHIWALAISAILFIIGLIFDFSQWTSFFIFFISYVLVGFPVLSKAAVNITKGNFFDESFLMGIATIGAFAIGQFPEGAAVMLFYQVGELFEDIAVDHSRKSIKSLMNIRPDEANIYLDGDIKRVPAQNVKIGETIVVKPGERVPLDGIVLEGVSMADTSALTGEPVPVEIKAGDEILAGFINQSSVLKIEVNKEFGESTVSKVLDMVQNAGSKKAKTERFMAQFARYYTPSVVGIAAVLAFILPIFAGNFSNWLYRALIFLVISCPCALVISIPLTVFAGIGAASKKGILIKGGNYLEALDNVSVVVMDKTGTITRGVFEVTEIQPEAGITKEELLYYAAYGEGYSTHPIAESLLKAYGQGIDKEIIKGYKERPGNGIEAIVGEFRVLVGNKRLMDSYGIEVEEVNRPGTIVYIAADEKYVGYILISDIVKDDAKEAICDLKSIGVKDIIMLTGDNDIAARSIAQEIGITQVYAKLLPHQKVERLESIIADKEGEGAVIFVGDGINDAPVLARADIGVAMGGLGSDAAIEAADVVLMTDQISKLVQAMKISRRTKRIMIQNIIFALGVKLIVLVLGAFGVATMWEAVFADVGVTIIAILNAMRVMVRQG